MINTITDGKVDEKFVRTCPVGVKSCFGATGFYDHEDNDPENDIWIRFLGCSEAKYMHEYGCDRDMQKVSVKDKNDRRIQVHMHNFIKAIHNGWKSLKKSRIKKQLKFCPRIIFC